MFAGTAGLTDYSQPEDSSFRGMVLISTPSPQQAPPYPSPASLEKKPAPVMQVLKRPACRADAVDTPKKSLRSLMVQECPSDVAESEESEELPATQMDDDDEADDEGADGEPGGGLAMKGAPPAVKAAGPVVQGAGPVVEEAGPVVKSAGPAVQASTADEAALSIPSPSSWLKTFAGRYEPKTAAGSKTWQVRRALYYELLPPGYQTTKLQLSFWKFCSAQIAATSCSEEEAAKEFVRQGLGATAAEE